MGVDQHSPIPAADSVLASCCGWTTRTHSVFTCADLDQLVFLPALFR